MKSLCVRAGQLHASLVFGAALRRVAGGGGAGERGPAGGCGPSGGIRTLHISGPILPIWGEGRWTEHGSEERRPTVR